MLNMMLKKRVIELSKIVGGDRVAVPVGVGV